MGRGRGGREEEKGSEADNNKIGDEKLVAILMDLNQPRDRIRVMSRVEAILG